MKDSINFHKQLKRKILRIFFRNPLFPRFKQTRKLYYIVVKNEKIRKHNQNKYHIPIPPLCMFSVTWNCNLACTGCYAMNYKKGNTLKIDEIEKILMKLISYGTYTFIITGGEPLTVKGLISTIEKINSGIYFLFTNGLLIDIDIAKHLKKNQNIIPVISLEGEPYQTDTRRGINVSGQLDETFKLLKKFRITYGISSMATHLNFKYLISAEYSRRLSKIGASFLYIIDYVPFDFSLNEKYIMSKDDYEIKKAELKQMSGKHPLVVFNFPADEYENGACAAGGKGFLHINANGYVEPCPFSHFAKDHILGKDYIEILQSDFLTEIRSQIHILDHKTGNCLLFENKKIVEGIAQKMGAFCTENAAKH